MPIHTQYAGLHSQHGKSALERVREKKEIREKTTTSHQKKRDQTKEKRTERNVRPEKEVDMSFYTPPCTVQDLRCWKASEQVEQHDVSIIRDSGMS